VTIDASIAGDLVGDIERDIEGITRSIWETVFNLPLVVRPGEATGDAAAGTSTLTGCIHIDGAWRGAVLLQCPVSLAASLAAALFDSGGEPSIDEMRDTLGELTNMLAGNIKALLPEPSHISLPAVAGGSDYQLSVTRTTPVAVVRLSCDGQPVVVQLMQRLDDGPAGEDTHR
jgi:CheY-specific phosphatase CheX